ncbi:CRISPR-associated endonuclease Cas2 [Melioribacter sp. OK-6-Me]|uniref:CRISPR-associated endonuclease Cas2 n=1 Tax=unclassified Melioribacter TaxID=2627329 RepID=UPI003EDA9157
MKQYIITYDIPSDKRRNKICELLKDYGLHVQYSVFELELDDKDYKLLIKKIKKTINTSQDSVRIYTIQSNLDNCIIELGTDKFNKGPVIFID